MPAVLLRGLEMLQKITDIDYGVPAYSAFTASFSVAVAATDIFYIAGSTTKTIKISRLFYSAQQTAAAPEIISLRKRSTANTAGTAVATTKVPLDSTMPAATALVQHYTANPTVGTAIGSIWFGRVDIVALATSPLTGGFLGVEIDFLKIFGSPVILRGVAEGLSICHDTAAVGAGLVAHCGVIWTEE